MPGAIPCAMLATALAVSPLWPLNTAAAKDMAGGRATIQRLVVAEAGNMGIAPELALALAHAESDFRATAVSHAGARGVMQIMPLTAWAEYAIAPHELWRPRINIRLGLHFLNRLLRRYRGRVDLALSFYNGGSAVGDLPHARIIPATRAYVRRVQALRVNYRRLVRGGVYQE